MYRRTYRGTSVFAVAFAELAVFVGFMAARVAVGYWALNTIFERHHLNWWPAILLVWVFSRSSRSGNSEFSWVTLAINAVWVWVRTLMLMWCINETFARGHLDWWPMTVGMIALSSGIAVKFSK